MFQIIKHNKWHRNKPIEICDGFKVVHWIRFLTFNIGWFFWVWLSITFNKKLSFLLSTNSLVVRITTINAISAYQHYIGEFDSDTRRGVLDTHYVIVFVSDFSRSVVLSIHKWPSRRVVRLKRLIWSYDYTFGIVKLFLSFDEVTYLLLNNVSYLPCIHIQVIFSLLWHLYKRLIEIDLDLKVFCLGGKNIALPKRLMVGPYLDF